MHCLLCYNFLLLRDFKHCLQRSDGSVARGPFVFADTYGKNFAIDTYIKWRNLRFPLTFFFSELCFRILGQMQPSSLRAKITKTKVKPKQKSPERWWPGKLETMFKNSQRENFFVPSMSFGEVCGKAAVCELSFQ